MLEDARTLEEAVFQALGAASVAWENPGGAGLFDAGKAKEIGDELMDRIRAEMKEPRLGLATTKEIIGELAARADVASTVGESWPEYTTVGG